MVTFSIHCKRADVAAVVGPVNRKTGKVLAVLMTVSVVVSPAVFRIALEWPINNSGSLRSSWFGLIAIGYKRPPDVLLKSGKTKVVPFQMT